MPMMPPPNIGVSVGCPQASPMSIQEMARSLICNESMRAAMRSKLFREDCHFVYQIDWDIAGKRSWSQSAKIAFQRQRNVANQETLLFNGRSDVYGWLIDLVSPGRVNL